MLDDPLEQKGQRRFAMRVRIPSRHSALAKVWWFLNPWRNGAPEVADETGSDRTAFDGIGNPGDDHAEHLLKCGGRLEAQNALSLLD
jgi:hypothetical protein